MNQKTYRLVYSRLRGMLVAVEETATAAGKAGETRATGRASGALEIFLSLRQLALTALLALSPLMAGAQIAPGGARAWHGHDAERYPAGQHQQAVRCGRVDEYLWPVRRAEERRDPQ
ncbi:ESPR domain-containing protein [Paraburkholderia caribensis]|uniref:ESPR domain-containing protein n=1 Tax=Paraburkholderia caribensis TaxID=75105 RepID=UPI001E3698FC|nr:ESPR domain-containing protein [Paraburkholderia caribensis]